MMRLLLTAVAFVFVLWTTATSLTQVQSHQRAVVRRFGRILEHKPEQGLYIGLPWGIDRVELVHVGREQTVTVGFVEKEEKDDEVIPAGQMLTGDHNLVNVQASINYRIREAEIESYVLQKDQVDGFVARAAETLLAEWIAARNVDDVLNRGRSELPRFLQEHLQDRLKAYDLGIDVGLASVKLEPPEQVRAAFHRLAQAKTSIDTKVSQAEQDAGIRRSDAGAEAFRIERQARAYANEELSKASAEAYGFHKRLDLYRDMAVKNPDYLNALWLDEMTRIYAKMREAGRVELLDHFLTSEGLTITQFPLQPKKR